MVQCWWNTMLMGMGTRFPGPVADLGLGTSGAESQVTGSTAELKHQQHALDYWEMNVMFWCTNGEWVSSHSLQWDLFSATGEMQNPSGRHRGGGSMVVASINLPSSILYLKATTSEKNLCLCSVTGS